MDFLYQLPTELIREICEQLANQDIKNFRLTCRRFRDITLLCLMRVFLSPNPLNIRVMREIANHQQLQHQIVELVYDYTRLPKIDEVFDVGSQCSNCQRKGFDVSVERWTFNEYNKAMARLREDFHKRSNRPDYLCRKHQLEPSMSPASSYQRYLSLCRQQEVVLAADDFRGRPPR